MVCVSDAIKIRSQNGFEILKFLAQKSRETRWAFNSMGKLWVLQCLLETLKGSDLGGNRCPRSLCPSCNSWGSYGCTSNCSCIGRYPWRVLAQHMGFRLLCQRKILGWSGHLEQSHGLIWMWRMHKCLAGHVKVPRGTVGHQLSHQRRTDPKDTAPWVLSLIAGKFSLLSLTNLTN